MKQTEGIEAGLTVALASETDRGLPGDFRLCGVATGIAPLPLTVASSR